MNTNNQKNRTMKKTNLILVLAFFVCSFIHAQYSAGSKVLILYQEQWYPGKIIEVKSDGYLISYDNYDASWNETVKADRLKSVTEAKGNSTNVNAPKTKADEMCSCLKKMMQTQKQEDKSRCLRMQEDHVVALVEGSASYTEYKKLVSECEKEITASKSKNAGVNTYEEKVKSVCDCFADSKLGKKQKYECFQLQSTYGKTLGDKKVDFNNETNKCDN